MKLEIPREALNTISHEDEKSSVSSSVSAARGRKISCFTRLLEPSFYEPFYFLVISGPDHGLVNETCQDSLAKKLVAGINSLEPLPKFVVIIGGLVPFFSKLEHPDFSLEDTLSKVSSKVRVVCVASKKDFGESPKSGSIESYRDQFGDDWFEFWACGVSFIVINSLYFHPNLNSLDAFQREQEDWIEGELLQRQFSKAKYTVVLQDRPWFLEDSNEADSNDNIARDFRVTTLRKFSDAGVSHVFCREQNTERTADASEYGLTLVTTRIISPENPKIRLVKILSDRIDHQLLDLNNLPMSVSL